MAYLRAFVIGFLVLGIPLTLRPAVAQHRAPISCAASPGTSPPVIDVHMHAVGAPAGVVSPAGGPASDALLDAVIAELNAHNVVRVVVSSLDLSRTRQWASKDPRFVPSLAFRDPSAVSVDAARDLLQRGVVQAFGELGFQYAGLRPDDPSLDGYFALAEQRDVPVSIHMAGGGLPNIPGFRVRLGDPLLLEEVLIRHPKLRVNVMHAGLPFLDGMLAIMRRYPLVYADLSKISDARAYPRAQFHEYLHSLMRAGLGDRLMFGSDAAGPGAIGHSIEGITTAPFLSEAHKRAIFCDNAARFFQLTDTADALAR